MKIPGFSVSTEFNAIIMVLLLIVLLIPPSPLLWAGGHSSRTMITPLSLHPPVKQANTVQKPSIGTPHTVRVNRDAGTVPLWMLPLGRNSSQAKKQPSSPYNASLWGTVSGKETAPSGRGRGNLSGNGGGGKKPNPPPGLSRMLAVKSLSVKPFFTVKKQKPVTLSFTLSPTQLSQPEAYSPWFSLPSGANYRIDIRVGWWKMPLLENQQFVFPSIRIFAPQGAPVGAKDMSFLREMAARDTPPSDGACALNPRLPVADSRIEKQDGVLLNYTGHLHPRNIRLAMTLETKKGIYSTREFTFSNPEDHWCQSAEGSLPDGTLELDTPGFIAAFGGMAKHYKKYHPEVAAFLNLLEMEETLKSYKIPRHGCYLCRRITGGAHNAKGWVDMMVTHPEAEPMKMTITVKTVFNDAIEPE